MRRFLKAVLFIQACTVLVVIVSLGVPRLRGDTLFQLVVQDGAALPSYWGLFYSVILCMIMMAYRCFRYVVNPEENGSLVRVKLQDVLLLYGAGLLPLLWFGWQLAQVLPHDSLHVLPLMVGLPLFSFILSGYMVRPFVVRAWQNKALAMRRAYTLRLLVRLGYDNANLQKHFTAEASPEDIEHLYERATWLQNAAMHEVALYKDQKEILRRLEQNKHAIAAAEAASTQAKESMKKLLAL